MEGNELQHFLGEDFNILIESVAFAPDGKSILAGSIATGATLWDMAGNKLQNFQVSAAVQAVAYAPDSKYILTGLGDGMTRLWDLEGNELQIFKGHSDEINAVAFSPDGKTSLTGSSCQESYCKIFEDMIQP